MRISQTRIRSLTRHFRSIRRGSTVVPAVDVASMDGDLLGRIGFPSDTADGEAVLPAGVFGPASRFNAEGKFLVHKDQPMETAYRQMEWTWEEFHGPYDRVEQSKIVDVPYKRYPRTFIEPPSVELTMRITVDGRQLLTGPSLVYRANQEESIVHAINLFLEVFGYCDIVTENLEAIITAPTRRLNWRILPPGRHPWTSLRPAVGGIIGAAPEGNRPVIEYRLETINGYEPSFVAIGQAGFHGYFVFGFPEKNLYVLESAYTGNATYVFAHDWEKLSQLTKAEVLSEGAQEDRIIHREGWENRINALLSQ